jgi:tetratricopeptide (TPR) repeat protein
MKSSQLKFANPHLNTIDFEIIPNSDADRFLGQLYIAGIVFTVLVFLMLIGFLPWDFSRIGPYLTALMVFVVLKLFRAAKKHLHNPMSIVKDRRAPIVYLRSFSDDQEDDDKRWDQKTAEELITSALKHIGPVLTVKDPRQDRKLLGATRIVMGENWQVEMEKLISIAQFVIVEANYTDSLVWELQLIKKSSRPEQLIISFLSRDEYHENDTTFGEVMKQADAAKSYYEEFDNAFSQIFGTSLKPNNFHRLCFFHFDNAWRAKPVTLELESTPFHRLSLLIYTPFIFSKRFKRHLPFWKVKRALMLILHDNGLVAHKEYVKEIDAERREIETSDNNPAPDRDTEPQEFGTAVLGLINDEDERNKRLFVGLGVAAGLAVIGIGGLVLANLSSAPVQSYLEKGLNCGAIGRMQCAIENCTRAIEIEPGNAQAYLCLGDAHANDGNYRLAIAQYDKALELDPNVGDAYYNRAASYFNLQDYDHAISDTALAKSRNPNKAIYFGLSGRAFLKKYDYENALRELRRAVELDERNASRFYDLSMAQQAVAQNEDAILSITSAIELEPNNPSYYSYRAWMYVSEKQYDLGISDYGRAIDLRPDSPELFYNRGLAYCHRKSSSKTDDYRRAVEDFSRVILLDDGYKDAFWNRSFAHNKLGEKRQAESDFKTYQRLNRLSKNRRSG